MSVSPAKKSHEGLSTRSGGIKMLTGTRVQNEKKKKKCNKECYEPELQNKGVIFHFL